MYADIKKYFFEIEIRREIQIGGEEVGDFNLKRLQAYSL